MATTTRWSTGAAVPVGRVYRFDQIAQAHTDMEQNRASGKLVVTT